MIPISRPPHSTRLKGQSSAKAARAAVRSSTTGWRFFALPGIIMYFAGFFSYVRLATASRSAVSTMLWEWAMRVHIRRITGVSNFSDSSKAVLAKVKDSAESAGSSIGTFAAMA